MLRKNLFTLILLASLFCNSLAETYYISNKGNDSNNGISPVFAWKTIRKLNSYMNKILPGDAVLFERGGIFNGQIIIGTSGNVNFPVIFGAYGSGRNPIISGAIPLKNWTFYKKNIYKTNADTIVKNLFSGGLQKTLAKFPNSGFLRVGKPFPNPKNGFYDETLNQPENYWKGSNIRIRTINWAYENPVVKKFVNGNLTFDKPTNHKVLEGYGYYLDNNLNELDSQNEWFFGKGKNSGGTVYYYPKPGTDPNKVLTEGSVYSYGIAAYGKIENLIFKDLWIKDQYGTGIFLRGEKSNIQIENCTFSGQLTGGVQMINASVNCKISNCRFYDINDKAIYLLNSTGTQITDNIFNNSGLIPGYGGKGDAFGMSAIVLLKSDSNIISGNNINNTGHGGINCIGFNNLIEKNIITNSMLLLNDGAAIKSFGLNTANSVWRNNFILNVPGNLESTEKKYSWNISPGIYLDNLCNNMEISDNTIANCGMAGIYIAGHIKNVKVGGNICFNNPVGIYFYIFKNSMSDNTITGNTFFGVNSEQTAVMIRYAKEKSYSAGFENNIYANPDSEAFFKFQSGKIITLENISGFRKELSDYSDINPKVISGSEIKFSKLFSNMTNDTSLVLLNPGRTYYDMELKEIHGTFTLLPYTSKIIVSDKSMDNYNEINVSGGPLNFGDEFNGSHSNLKWFKVYGEDLKEKIDINSPDGYEISISENSGFGNKINLNPVSGKIEKIVFVKFNPAEKNIYRGQISIQSGILKTFVKVSGNSR